MTEKFDPASPEGKLLAENALARREFLKKLGKYAAVTSATTATLLTAKTATAASAAYCAKSSCTLNVLGATINNCSSGCKCPALVTLLSPCVPI